jgi:predicted nucleic acid-binding protein
VRQQLNPIGFDSTVLINFGECGALDILVAATRPPRHVIGPVRRELVEPPTRDVVECAIAAGEVTATDLRPAEMADWARLARRLGAGEAATIAAAVHRGWTVACDDLAARKIAARELGQHRVIGTIGLLMCAVARRALPRARAQRLLERMIENGYWSPVAELPDET